MDLLAYDVKRAHWGMTCTALRRFKTEMSRRPELGCMTPGRFEILSTILLYADATGVDPVLPLTQIIYKLGLDRSTIARSVRRMEEIGYVERLPHPTDRRCILVKITKRGLLAMESARELLATRPNFLVERVRAWLGATGRPQTPAAHQRVAFEARLLARTFDHWSHAIFDPEYDHSRWYFSSRPAQSGWDEGPSLPRRHHTA